MPLLLAEEMERAGASAGRYLPPTFDLEADYFPLLHQDSRFEDPTPVRLGLQSRGGKSSLRAARPIFGPEP